uniref:Aquaporin 1a (Colton blood group), tandem duplicate 1 n=1 Tax=Oncorhynchus mykiss TaxID=8022 RepID=A0A8C7TH86_ONCMY
MREFKSKAFWRAVLAELVGMTMFIFLSISAAIGNSNNTSPDQEVKVSLTFGLAIATLAQSLGHISGAHLNPAVTLGMLASCQISVFKGVMYIVAQMLGSALASGIVYGTRPEGNENITLIHTDKLLLFGSPFCPPDSLSRHDVTGSAPLAIGLSVALGHLAAISYTGCGINPARSFGPALIMNDYTNHWVYWVGPMCGGVAAALVYDFLLYPKFDDFPERMRVLVSGPVGDYDVNGEETAAVEMSSK